MLSVSSDSDIEGLSQVVTKLHDLGCKAQIQLDHGCGWTVPALQSCLDPEKNPEARRVTDDISDTQLEEVVQYFASALSAQRPPVIDMRCSN